MEHDNPQTHVDAGGGDATYAELSRWLSEGYPRAFRTACLILHNAADAEEAVQDAYLRAWRFRASLPEGEGGRAWLYRVLVNACYSKLRAEGRHRSRGAGPEPLDYVASTGDDPESGARRSAMATAMTSALQSLPEHLRVPVVLRYYAGLSEREVAESMGTPAGTVKSRLHEARRRLAADPALQGWVE